MSIKIFVSEKAMVLAALYNGSQAQGMGFLHYDPKPMTIEQAEEILKRGQHFDYLYGRIMKIDLSAGEVKLSDFDRLRNWFKYKILKQPLPAPIEIEIDTWGYNRDNGENAAEKVLENLRQTNNTNSPHTQAEHMAKTLFQAVKFFFK